VGVIINACFGVTALHLQAADAAIVKMSPPQGIPQQHKLVNKSNKRKVLDIKINKIPI
jgi:hypothetical protein